MITALACPGPSLLATFPHRNQYDLVAAVNRSVHAVNANWWVFVDYQVWQNYKPDNPPRVFTTESASEHLERHDGEAWAKQGKTLTTEAMDYLPRDAMPWTMYSAVAGLVLLGWQGAEEVHVYGADWTNQPDWDGHNAPTNRRTDDRWQSEIALWTNAVAWLKGRGTEVIRHGIA